MLGGKTGKGKEPNFAHYPPQRDISAQSEETSCDAILILENTIFGHTLNFLTADNRYTWQVCCIYTNTTRTQVLELGQSVTNIFEYLNDDAMMMR